MGRVQYNPGNARAWAAGWTYASAREAVDAHKRGQFMRSYQLSIDIWAHPAIKAARDQRRSAASSVPYTLAGPERAPGRFEVEAAGALWQGQIARLVEDTIDDCAVMGFGVWQHPIELIEGRYVCQDVSLWPLSCVELGAAILASPGAVFEPDRYYARTASGEYVPLPRPGETDLHWTVFGVGHQPHLRGAIVALDLAFVAGQLGRRAMAKMLNTIGRTSPVGELPEGVPIRLPDGAENPIATDFLDTLSAMGETQAAAVHAKGGRIYGYEVTAQTGQLFPQWMSIAAQEIQWALLGHDRAIAEGDTYTDPKAQSIPQDLARRDVACIERGASALLTGLARMNVERCGPIEVRGHLPDTDQDERLRAENERRAADDAHAAAQLAAGKAAAEQLVAERAAGLLVDEARIGVVYGVARFPAPGLAATAPPQAQPAAAAPPPAPPRPAAA